jgi:CHASE2 domain-containing sensor protein
MLGKLSLSRRRVVHALLLGVAVSVGVTALSQIGALSGWETRAVDGFLFLRDRTPAPEIVLVVIDDEAFQELGERQLLSRRYLADPGEFLLQSGARTVAGNVGSPRQFSDPATRQVVFSYAHPIFWAPFTLAGDSGGDTTVR